MKKRKLVSCLAIAVVFMFSAALLAMAAQQVPETITIKPPIWSTLTKTPVEFSHKKHSAEYKIACDQCHHVIKDGKNIWKEGDEVQKCEKCHTEATTQGEMKLPPDQKKLNLKMAFHNRCQNCHKKVKAEKPESKAPTTCAGCHPAKAQ
ncbi:Cytochrome c, class III [Syntrophobacter sp. SbD1]|nr:Cytochrome c, class III [Syntrophobacter sp. SbD1]